MSTDTPLAIETAIITNIDAIVAIGWIIRKAAEAKKFRDKCLELSRDAALLQSILQIKSNGVKNLETARGLAECLQRVRAFIQECSDYNILQTAWEVFSGNSNFLDLKSELLKYVTFFMAESLTVVMEDHNSTREVLMDLSSGQRAMRQLVEVAAATQLLEKRQHAPQPISQMNFAENDPRLQLESPPGTSGELRGRLANLPIICEPLIRDFLVDVPKFIRNYQLIESAATQVRKFHGVLERDGKKYAIMQDLSEESTLGEGVGQNIRGSGILASLSVQDRLALAYEICSTLAILHRAEILLKNISDQTVVLVRSEPSGKFRPVLTELENARMFLESTGSVEYDIRFEPPETSKIRRHTKYSDIWSLGVIIWECIAVALPFDCSFSELGNSVQDIRRRLDANERPFREPTDTNLFSAYQVVKRCWSHNAVLRPSAHSLADDIIDLIVRLASTTLTYPVLSSEDNSTLQEDIWEAIQKCRQANAGSKEIRFKQEELDNLVKAQADPFCMFLKGAAIYWGLVSYNATEQLESASGTLGEKEKRALVAIKYLIPAANANRTEAYEELYRAYRMLAKRDKE